MSKISQQPASINQYAETKNWELKIIFRNAPDGKIVEENMIPFVLWCKKLCSMQTNKIPQGSEII